MGTSKFYHLPGPLGGLGPILTRFLSLLVSELLRKLNTYQKKRLMVRQISKFSLIIKSAIARIPNCFFGGLGKVEINAIDFPIIYNRNFSVCEKKPLIFLNLQNEEKGTCLLSQFM